jgi:hypothetical protein
MKAYPNDLRKKIIEAYQKKKDRYANLLNDSPSVLVLYGG